MLPIKLKLPDGFLLEETRDGYTVGSEMKELWAVSLDLLNELLRCCRENNITVYAGYGTLLGAIRHGGFIPWDDDIDLVMKREDYDRFCQKARFEEPYFLQTEYTDIGFSRAFARLRNDRTTCIQAYEKNMDIRYNQGCFIDIFPLDYAPDDPEERKKLGREIRNLRQKAMAWSLFSFRAPGKRSMNGTKDRIKHAVSRVSMPLLKAWHFYNPYIREMDKLTITANRTDKLVERWFFDPEKNNGCWKTADFDHVVYHKFEMLEIPVPAGYESVLEDEFGDWRTPVYSGGDHGDLEFDCHTPWRKR